MGKSLKDQLQNLSVPAASKEQKARASQYIRDSAKKFVEDLERVDPDSPEFLKVMHTFEARELFRTTKYDKRVTVLRMLIGVDRELHSIYSKIHIEEASKPCSTGKVS